MRHQVRHVIVVTIRAILIHASECIEQSRRDDRGRLNSIPTRNFLGEIADDRHDEQHGGSSGGDGDGDGGGDGGGDGDERW